MFRNCSNSNVLQLFICSENAKGVICRSSCTYCIELISFNLSKYTTITDDSKIDKKNILYCNQTKYFLRYECTCILSVSKEDSAKKNAQAFQKFLTFYQI